MNRKAIKAYTFYTLHEFLSSLMMFFAFFPISTIIPDASYVGWTYHFLCVIITDILSLGATVNPSVIIALYIYGQIKLDEALTRILGHLLETVPESDINKPTSSFP